MAISSVVFDFIKLSITIMAISSKFHNLFSILITFNYSGSDLNITQILMSIFVHLS